jgi:hypothetical protein
MDADDLWTAQIEQVRLALARAQVLVERGEELRQRSRALSQRADHAGERVAELIAKTRPMRKAS